MRGVSWNPIKDRLRLPGPTKISTYLSSPGQLRSSGLRAWKQLKQRRVWSALNSGPARPSAARSGNGARRGRRYAPLLCCGRPPDYAKESRPGGVVHRGSPPLVIDRTNRPSPLMNRMVLRPSFDSDGRHRLDLMRPAH